MTLVVTGHLAPRHGGVETVTEQLARRLPTDRVVVMAPRADGDREVDRTLPFEVIRYAGRFISRPWLAREVAQTAIARRAEAAWITSAMPLGALAVPLRRAGVGRIVVTTHGMEIGWASVPPAAAVMRWVAGHADVVTYLGEFTHTRLTPALPATVETVRLTGGVDATHFAPTEQSALRERLGLADRRVVVSASRLVPRKGQDMLIRAWPMVQRRHPGARLLIVGDGRRRQALARLAAKVGVAPDVVFAGGAALDQLPAYLGCGDVFALPCRDVWAGLQVEGLGLSILEASAVGLPVVAGRSGGSPDAVRDGVTGLLVDGTSCDSIADALDRLLSDPEAARRMGRAGRDWVIETWNWDLLAARLLDALASQPVAEVAA